MECVFFPFTLKTTIKEIKQNNRIDLKCARIEMVVKKNTPSVNSFKPFLCFAEQRKQW